MRTTPSSELNADGPIEQASVQSVGKAMAIVELLMRTRASLSAKVIADQVGVNRTTTHRLLRALMQLGWVEKPPAEASYRLSIRFLALAHVASQSRSFMDDIRPSLERLSALTRETVHVGVRDGYDVVHIDRIDSPERVGVASKIGGRATLHTTALGKAMLADETPAELDSYTAHCLANGELQPATAHALREEITRTRSRGYSIDDEEDSIGVRCLGVAVIGAGGSPLFAISVTGPSPRFTLDHVVAYAPELMSIAAALSQRFGWNGRRPLHADAQAT